jgi:hypothetical protein
MNSDRCRGAAVAGSAGPQPPSEPAEPPRLRPADGIYGTIITASVLASAGDELAAGPLAVSVVITIAVYWLVDVYSELLGGHFERGRLPSWEEVRTAMFVAWPMISASFIPLVVLGLGRLSGLSHSSAATGALASALAMLVIYAWTAGHAAQLRGGRLAFVTSIAAVLGILMIVLKNVVLVHLH